MSVCQVGHILSPALWLVGVSLILTGITDTCTRTRTRSHRVLTYSSMCLFIFDFHSYIHPNVLSAVCTCRLGSPLRTPYWLNLYVWVPRFTVPSRLLMTSCTNWINWVSQDLWLQKPCWQLPWTQITYLFRVDTQLARKYSGWRADTSIRLLVVYFAHLLNGNL